MSKQSDILKNLAVLNASSALDYTILDQTNRTNANLQNIRNTITNIGSITGLTNPAQIASLGKLYDTKINELKKKQADITNFSPNFLSSTSNTQSQNAIRDLIAQQGLRVLDSFKTTGTTVENAGKSAASNLYAISQNAAKQTNKTGINTFNNVSGLGTNLINSLGATSAEGTQRMANAAMSPLASIATMQNNPAFSALLNPTFTRLAFNPPPVQKATGLDKYYTYNV